MTGTQRGDRPDGHDSGKHNGSGGRVGRALTLAVTMFTVVPVPGRTDQSRAKIDARLAARALHWLPLVGALVGGLAMLPALAVWRGGGHGAPLLAAVLVVTTLALLTRGLHLDGLADLADGLGSRRPAEQALGIMAASDIGPFAVAALALTLLLDTAAIASILVASTRPSGVVAVVAAVTVGRVAALWAAGRGVTAARPGGFGALVAGSASWPARIAITAATLAAALGCDWWAGQRAAGLARLGGSCLAGLAIAGLVRKHAVARLGGITGDVFGALIEITTTVALVGYAGLIAWR